MRRCPDPCLVAVIARALNHIEIVVNVGAGTGSYEPTDCLVVAVELVMIMIR